MKLTYDNYKTFLAVCDIIKSMCSDIDINNGKILQISTNSLYFIESDLTPIMGDSDFRFMLSSCSGKLNLLQTFLVDGTDVDIISDDSYYTIFDTVSSLKIRMPEPATLTNKFDNTVDLSMLSNESKLFEIDLNKMMISRIKTSGDQADASSMEFVFNFETGKVASSIVSVNKTIEMKLFENDFNTQAYDNIDAPMKIAKLGWDCFVKKSSSDVKLQIFKRPNQNDFITSKTTITVDDVVQIHMYQNVFARSL